MKLGIFTTITDPYIRGDNYKDAIACYKDLADEVTIVDGGRQNQNTTDINYLYSSWQKEFSWELIGNKFQLGYEACLADIIIHADIDFIWHEQDFNLIRAAAQKMLDNKLPAMSMWKYQFIQPDRYNLKSRLITMVNKRDFEDRIKFDGGGESDLCQPSLDGKLIKPDDVEEARVPLYNYEHIIKTKEQTMDDVGRMDRAYFRKFNKYIYGKDGSDESAFEGWSRMIIGRSSKPSKHIPLSEHPKYVQETIKNLKPEQFGYNGFGMFDINDYAKSVL